MPLDNFKYVHFLPCDFNLSHLEHEDGIKLVQTAKPTAQGFNYWTIITNVNSRVIRVLRNTLLVFINFAFFAIWTIIFHQLVKMQFSSWLLHFDLFLQKTITHVTNLNSSILLLCNDNVVSCIIQCDIYTRKMYIMIEIIITSFF